MDFKCAKLCVYICPYGCVCVCLLHDSGAVEQDARPHRSRNLDQCCPPCMFPRDADALTCLGRNTDTFHSIESLFLFLLSVSILREEKQTKETGDAKDPLEQRKSRINILLKKKEN